MRERAEGRTGEDHWLETAEQEETPMATDNGMCQCGNCQYERSADRKENLKRDELIQQGRRDLFRAMVAKHSIPDEEARSAQPGTAAEGAGASWSAVALRLA